MKSVFETMKLSIVVVSCVLSVGCGDDFSSDELATHERALNETALPINNAIQLDCRPVNNFGYIGKAKGPLAITSTRRYPDGRMNVKGTLAIRVGAYGSPLTLYPAVEVAGFVDRTGQYSLVNVVSGAPSLKNLVLYFNANVVSSSIHEEPSTIDYQTDCSFSTVTIPHAADLIPDRKMRFYPNGPGMIGVQVDVTNFGDQPAVGPSGHLSIGTTTLSAKLYQYFGGSATTPNTVNPGERGYLKVNMPASALQDCTKYPVKIDLDHNQQFGQPNPFANDSANVATQCVLTWTLPITAKRLGTTPDPKIANVSIEDIVSSRVVARADGNKCSACHFQTSGRPYSPPVTQNGTATISPFQTIGGRTWADVNGWSDRFQSQGPGTAGNKPDYLRNLFAKWEADGKL